MADVTRTCVAGLLCGLSMLTACGGTSEVERKQPPKPEVATGLDFYDCEAIIQEYEFELLSDVSSFDQGDSIRGSGPPNYYANNDETNPARELTPSEIANQVGGKRPPCDCEPDSDEAVEGGPEIKPVEGGAPSFGEASLCMASSHSVQLVSRGKGFSGWGMVFGGSFDEPNTETEDPDDQIGVDVSLWDGIAFWTKRLSSDPVSMFASVVDNFTSSKGGICQDEGLLENSCDAFGIGVGFQAEWRLVLVPFDVASQRGFGMASPNEHVKTDNFFGFGLYMPSGVWDVRVDEMSLYRRK